MTDLYKQAGNRLFLIRVMRGFTRDYVAEVANISAKFLYEIESGRTGFSAGVLYSICNVLQVSCDYIMTGNEKKEYDKSLLEVLELFNVQQNENIVNILKEILKMIEK